MVVKVHVYSAFHQLAGGLQLHVVNFRLYRNQQITKAEIEDVEYVNLFELGTPYSSHSRYAIPSIEVVACLRSVP